ncbi:MAG: hypothetical protein ACOYMS_11055, partial [Terrimicrobiaceae bacterium]
MPDSPKNKILLLLGMHCGGTSVLSGALQILGADHAPDSGLAALHERFLTVAGSSWHDVAPLIAGWKDGEGSAWFRDQLKEILQRCGSTTTLTSFADPNLCKLLPLWLPVLDELGLEPAYTIISRNPLAVAAELKTSNGLDEPTSHLLWVQHMLAAEKNSRGSNRTFLTYDELLDDPLSALGKIAFDLRLNWPKPVASAEEELRQFLDSESRDHRAKDDPADAVSPLRDLALRCVTVLQSGGACAGAGFEASLDAIARSLGDGRELLKT